MLMKPVLFKILEVVPKNNAYLRLAPFLGDNCVEAVFLNKGAHNCHECGRSLRKNNFRLQIFEVSPFQQIEASLS